jgi:protease PrsW
MMLVDFLPTSLGAAAVLPALMLLWLVVATDRRPEPPGLVGAAFLLGIAAIFLIHLAAAPLAPLVHAAAAHPWPSVVARAVLVAAVPEEAVKVALIALLVSRLRAVHEPIDGLVYGAAVGLGFAAWENLGYLARSALDWQTLALARDIVTVPFHGALGMIAGAYLAAARFSHALGAHRAEHSRARLIALAVVVPMGLHAAFDIPVLALHDGLAEGAGPLALVAPGLVVAFGAMAFAYALARRLAAHQKLLPGALHRPLAGWRAVWAIVTLGAAAGLAGAALVISAAHRARLFGPDLVALACGATLIVAAAAILRWSRGHLRATGSTPAVAAARERVEG